MTSSTASSPRNDNNGALCLAVVGTAALVGAACASYLSRRNRFSHDMTAEFEIPKELRRGYCLYAEEMQLAVQLALQAGGNMVQHLDQKGSIMAKEEDSLGISKKTNDADFATAIDICNEELITTAIHNSFPTHTIIGEESTGTDQPKPLLPENPTWFIDPIDGTTNFVAGLPLTCVSIGYCVNGEPVMGVVYAPATRELYLAAKYCGAYRNGIRIASSTSTSTTLKDAIVCYELGYVRSPQGIATMLSALQRLLLYNCRATRSLGSGVLDLCYVSCGRIDVLYTGISEEGWKPWDYCAGMAIARESGCTICSLYDAGFDAQGHVVDGSNFDIYSTSMICGGNKALVEECRRVVLDL